MNNRVRHQPVPYSTSAHSFAIKVGSIACSITFPTLQKGITGLINEHGSLYYGTMPKHYFLYQHFLSKKHAFIRQLNAENPDPDSGFKNEMSFRLQLCREARKTKWRWPALMNRFPDGSIELRTGSSRGLATILTTPEPWLHLPVLFYEKPGFKTCDVLENFVEIKTDEELHNALDCEYNEEVWDPEAHLTINFNKLKNIIWPTIDAVNGGQGNFEFNLYQSSEYYDNFAAWQQRYPSKPTIHVYTEWPQLIQDINNIWNVVHAGPSQPIIDDMNDFGGRVGRLENICRIMHVDARHDKDFTLYVVKPRKIDIGDLLLWMDLAHTTYIEKDWDFLLYRKDKDYKNTFINCSFVE